jgi:hypothetical protein
MSSSLFKTIEMADLVINQANIILDEYRKETHDVFLTSFKGLRSDGAYRRRLDWDTASRILGTALVRIDPSLENIVTPGTRLF